MGRECDESCGNSHKCAVLLQTGRPCGGRHGAHECRARRKMKVETPVPSAAPEGGSSGSQPVALVEAPVRPAAAGSESLPDSSRPRKRQRLADSEPASLHGGTRRLAGGRGGTSDGSSAGRRDGDWHLIWPLVPITLAAGEHILVHCKAGRRRAEAVCTLLKALLERSSLNDAMARIRELRPIEADKLFRESPEVPEWMQGLSHTLALPALIPQPMSFAATSRSVLHVCDGLGVPLCQHRQSRDKAIRLREPWTTEDKFEAGGWGRPSCVSCFRLVPASWLVDELRGEKREGAFFCGEGCALLLPHVGSCLRLNRALPVGSLCR